MRAGLLNQRITFQRKQVARDPLYGAEVITWVDYATTWANVNEQRAMERVLNNERVATRVALVTTRWVAGVTSDMRIRIDADVRYFQITSIAEQRKRIGIVFMCEEYSV